MRSHRVRLWSVGTTSWRFCLCQFKGDIWPVVSHSMAMSWPALWCFLGCWGRVLEASAKEDVYAPPLCSLPGVPWVFDTHTSITPLCAIMRHLLYVKKQLGTGGWDPDPSPWPVQGTLGSYPRLPVFGVCALRSRPRGFPPRTQREGRCFQEPASVAGIDLPPAFKPEI